MAKVKLNTRVQTLRTYCDDNGLKYKPDRTAVVGYKWTVAGKVNAANRGKSLDFSGERGIIKKSGAISGALNPLSKRADEHAERYYAAVRKMTTDVKRISENTGYSEELIQSIKDFVFNEKHDLGNKFDFFVPDYKMAKID